MSLFVVFEGIEGSGKTTQAGALGRRLAESGLPTTLVREPGGTPTGELIAKWIKTGEHIRPLAELFLLSAARVSLVEMVIQPALDRGDVVVCDRYIYSTLAYQGAGRGLDIGTIRKTNLVATGGLVPQLVVLLDLPAAQGLGRIDNRKLDRIESEPPDFHERVRDSFLKQAEASPDLWLVLDSIQSPPALAETVWSSVSRLLQSRGQMTVPAASEDA